MERARDWWEGGLRRRLILTNTLLILGFGVSLGYLAFRVGLTGVRDEVVQRNDQLATLVAADVQTELSNVFGNVRLFTYQLEANTDMLPLQARAMLEFRRASPLTYRALYLYDNSGRQLVRVDEPLDDLLLIEDIEDLITRPPAPVVPQVTAAFKMARGGSTYVTGTSLSMPDRLPVTYAGIPLMVDDRGAGQVVVAVIDLRDIWRRIDSVFVGRSGRAFVVSQEGMIIAHPDRLYIGKMMDPALAPVLEGQRGHIVYFDRVEGEEKYASFSPVGGESGWGVVVEQDSVEALRRVNQIAEVTVAVLLGGILLSFLLTIVITRSVVEPIKRLVQSTERISETGDLEHQVELDTAGEVGQLAASFNQMIVRLRGAQTQLKQLNVDLERKFEVRTTQLRESEARYRAIVEDQTELICRVSPDGKLSFVNDAFIRYFDLQKRNPLGRPFMAYVRGEDVSIVRDAVRSRSAKEPVACVDFRVQLNDGQLRWHRWSLRAITDEDGNMMWIQGVGRDVTDELRAQTALREAKEAAEAASSAKDEFLASMSHELRTPLNAVLGLAEALQEGVYGPLTDKQSKSLATIESSGRHLLSLINDILDVSRIEADSFRLDTAITSVRDVCQASHNLVRPEAERKGIQVVIEAEHAPETIVADKRRLVQVLVNLLSNAVKFSDEGGKVGLQVVSIPDDEAIVSFTVWDTGIGISATDMRRLFRPFVQVDSSLSRRYGGTGLGLVLAYRLTEMHGGSIGVESSPGNGSRFSIWLPVSGSPGREERDGRAVLGRADAPTQNQLRPASEAVPAGQSGARLLVVDGTRGSGGGLSRSLRAGGFVVMLTRELGNVPTLVREWNPALLLLNVAAERDASEASTGCG